VQLLNALTVDVEDYYQVSAFEHRIARSEWDSHESRVVRNTRLLLSVFRDHAVCGTFFVLGWVADRFPHLVEEICDAGHELASHGYWHRMVHDLTPAEFRDDLRKSKELLERIAGKPVVAYRAPSFSITARSLWALDILVDEGFLADSSIFPVRHDRYGMPNAATEPHYIELRAGRLLEFPPSVLPLGRYRLPVAGGGYFRLLPKGVTYHAVRRCNRHRAPFMFYIHPWELDPAQPRVHGVGWKARARHYVNLRRTETKLRWLLNHASFGPMAMALRQAQWPVHPMHETGQAASGPSAVMASQPVQFSMGRS
jgi:polysaccharide deacetylase family protein (PEP-CTERM system associated)